MARSPGVSSVGPWCVSHTSMRPSRSPEQESDSFPNLVSGWAQPGIARAQHHSLQLRKRFPRSFQDVLLLAASGTFQQQVHHSGQFGARQRFALHQLEKFRLVARRKPHQLPRCRGRQQPYPQLVAGLWPQSLDQRQPAAYPTLVTPQQLRYLHLARSILAYQGMHDPSFFSSRVRPSARFSP